MSRWGSTPTPKKRARLEHLSQPLPIPTDQQGLTPGTHFQAKRCLSPSQPLPAGEGAEAAEPGLPPVGWVRAEGPGQCGQLRNGLGRGGQDSGKCWHLICLPDGCPGVLDRKALRSEPGRWLCHSAAEGPGASLPALQALGCTRSPSVLIAPPRSASGLHGLGAG